MKLVSSLTSRLLGRIGCREHPTRLWCARSACLKFSSMVWCSSVCVSWAAMVNHRDLWHQSAFKVDLGGRSWQLKYFFVCFTPKIGEDGSPFWGSPYFSEGVGNPPPTSGVWNALDFNRGVDAVFLMDMVLQFFTMYPKRHLGVAFFLKCQAPFFHVAHLEMIKYHIMLIS